MGPVLVHKTDIKFCSWSSVMDGMAIGVSSIAIIIIMVRVRVTVSGVYHSC